MNDETRSHPFRDSTQDVVAAAGVPDTAQTRSPAYRLAFADPDFLTAEALRPVRLQLELLKPQMMLDAAGVDSTVVLLGSARVPGPGQAGAVPGLDRLAPHYDEARRLARIVTERSLEGGGRDWVIVTGGGPGIMEAGNRGATDAGGRSIGLNIVLPHEQAPNAWVTPELCFNFHYFAVRKMHFLMRARAICTFPGGFGTMDELFETLTLIQTGRMKRVPVVLFGREWWERVVDWRHLAEAGVISPQDLALFRFVESAEEALAMIDGWDRAAA